MCTITVVYIHIGMTLLLCLFELQGRPPVQWIVVYLNLGVHVVMYFYYFLAALKIRVWWKQAVTVLQIVQFIVDLIIIYSCCAILVLMRTEMVSWSCYGSTFSAVFGVSLLSSYLVLFIYFYKKTYKEKKPVTKPYNLRNKKRK